MVSEAEVVPTGPPPQSMLRDPTPRMLWQTLLSLWFVPLLGAAAALALVPWFATPDSGGYLHNAEVLFGNEYVLIREPGLSLLIRGLWETVGRDDLYYVAVNGTLAGVAVALAAATFPELGGRRRQATASVLTLLAPVYLVYAGMVLQQIGMAALLSGIGLTLRWVTLQKPVQRKPLFLLTVLLTMAAYWAAVFLYVGVAVAIAVAAWVWCGSRYPTDRRARAAIAWALIAVAIVPVLAMVPWWAWKTRVADQKNRQVVLEGEFLSRIASGLREDPGWLIESRALSMVGLLQLEYPLRIAGAKLPKAGDFPDSEDLQWTRRLAASDAPCGLRDVVPKYRRRFPSWVDSHCRHWAPMRSYARLAKPSYLYGGLASIALFAFTIWSAARRSGYLLVLAAPWSWLGFYTMAGAAIDRYAIPIWPLKTYLVTMMLFAASEQLVRRLRHSFAVTTQPPLSIGATLSTKLTRR